MTARRNIQAFFVRIRAQPRQLECQKVQQGAWFNDVSVPCGSPLSVALQ